MKGIDFLSPPDFEKKVLNSKTPSLVEFYADWSIPCQKVSKITNQLATKNLEEIAHIKFSEKDVVRHPLVAKIVKSYNESK